MNSEEIHSYRDVMVQNYYYMQLRISGYNTLYEIVLGAEEKVEERSDEPNR
jgi:hypothetical protein